MENEEQAGKVRTISKDSDPEIILCKDCGGTGYEKCNGRENEKCEFCEGSGRIVEIVNHSIIRQAFKEKEVKWRWHIKIEEK